MTVQREQLTAIALNDLVASFGWEDRPLLAAALHWLYRRPAETFAGHMAELDAAVGDSGALCEPARDFLDARYVSGLEIAGQENIPSGPALFVANHPGLTDTLALFAAMGRDDLKVMAEHRPFLATLTHLATHLIFVDSNLGRRALAVQAMVDHLRAGGAVLTFPAGRIEADPDIHDSAIAEIAQWPDMTRLVARMAPETRIVPVAVRGVIAAKPHWLARIKRTASERDKRAAALQLVAMVAHGARPTTARVRFGTPLLIADFAQNIEGLHNTLIARMGQLIADGRAAVPTALAATPEERLDWRPANTGVVIQ